MLSFNFSQSLKKRCFYLENSSEFHRLFLGYLKIPQTPNCVLGRCQKTRHLSIRWSKVCHMKNEFFHAFYIAYCIYFQLSWSQQLVGFFFCYRKYFCQQKIKKGYVGLKFYMDRIIQIMFNVIFDLSFSNSYLLFTILIILKLITSINISCIDLHLFISRHNLCPVHGKGEPGGPLPHPQPPHWQLHQQPNLRDTGGLQFWFQVRIRLFSSIF